MADKYLEKGVNIASGAFTGVFGLDLVTNTNIVESLIGSGDATAIAGVGLVVVGGTTVYATGRWIMDSM